MWQLNETGQVPYKNYEVQLKMSKCIAKNTVFSLKELHRKTAGVIQPFFGRLIRREGDHKLSEMEKCILTFLILCEECDSYYSTQLSGCLGILRIGERQDNGEPQTPTSTLSSSAHTKT